ncbi:MAG: hypothetical protein AAGA57_09870 [Planctomycetota bacterium]
MSDGSWLDAWLGLQRLSLLDGGLSLGWRWALPNWAWAAVVIGAAAYAAWVYAGLSGSRLGRGLLATLRAVVLVWLVVLLCGPELVRRTERVEGDTVVVLVDRSASMGVEDVPAAGVSVDDAGDSAMLSRLSAARAALEQADWRGEGERNVVWLAFDDAVREVAGPGALEGVGGGTGLGEALEAARRAGGRESSLAGVVLVSDGRVPEGLPTRLVRTLERSGVGVWPTAVGDANPLLDVVLSEVELPDRVFAGDVVPVRARLRVSGGVESADGGIDTPGTVVVRLIDEVTGETIDEQRWSAAGRLGEVRLGGRAPAVEGGVRWRVEAELVETDAAERQTRNNTRLANYEVIDRPLRVLLIEGYPRWEYRYLKNLLLRERSIASSTFLLSADLAFAQEGDEPIARLPREAEEWSAYDVIILGDVPAGAIDATASAALRDQVVTRGAGLAWIGGDRSTPDSYVGTTLADLLPMRRPGETVPVGGDWLLEPSLLADALGVLQLTGPEVAAVSGVGWPAGLSPLRWVQRLGALKPTAEVLAWAVSLDPDASAGDARLPAIVRMRAGAGQTLYLATDEAWRWRYGRGELYHEQAWVQLIRLLARGRADIGSSGATLAVSADQVGMGQPLVIRLSGGLDGTDAAWGERVEIDIADLDAPAGTTASVERVTLLAEAVPADDRPGLETGPTGWVGRWVARRPGTYELRAVGLGAGVVEPVTVEVLPSEAELRDVRPDVELLAGLADATGGQLLTLDELPGIGALLPNRSRVVIDESRESLVHGLIGLAVALVLLGVEWVGRRWLRLA